MDIRCEVRTPHGRLIRFLVLWACFALMVPAILSGCGGMFQSTPGSPPVEQTRTRVKQLLASGLNAAALSGSPFSRNLQSASQADTGIGLVGSFVREGAIQNGDDGGEPSTMPEFYFDEWLGLWVQVQSEGSSILHLLYEDEGKTKPAGRFESTMPSDPDSHPQTYLSRYEITAGRLAGTRGEYVTTLQSETAGSMRYEHHEPDGAASIGQSSWDEHSYTWENRYQSADGFWSKDEGTFRYDGSGTTVSENSIGCCSRYAYYADGSGEGRIEGPDPGLPAAITWTSDGKYTIRWADGTVEEFNLWDTWIEDGDGADGSPGE